MDRIFAGIFDRGSAFVPSSFEEGAEETFEILAEKRVLLVGAGGIGCEVLKNLAMSGFKNIDVIDLDTIDLSNLNRQFLFRMSDVNKPKAAVAAEFVMKRCKGVKITPHQFKIQSKRKEWYRNFDYIIAGLDNVAARMWLNETICDLVKFDKDGNMDPESLIPYIDAGTEGLSGQTRLFLPYFNGGYCFNCVISGSFADENPGQVHAPLCTIASIPRTPEHCIQYAFLLVWPKLKHFSSCSDYSFVDDSSNSNESKVDSEGGVPLDKDNDQHMTWLYERALERAQEYKIDPLPTYVMTMQVIKNIIPAVASTNAIVSAVGSNEVFKLASCSSRSLDNWFFYNGSNTISTSTIKYKRNEDCAHCRRRCFISLPKDATMDDLKEILTDKIDKTGKFSLWDQIEETLVFFVGDDQKYNFGAIAKEKASKFVQEHSLYVIGSEKINFFFE